MNINLKCPKPERQVTTEEFLAMAHHRSQLCEHWGLSSAHGDIADTRAPDPQTRSFRSAHQPLGPHLGLLQLTVPFQMCLSLPDSVSFLFRLSPTESVRFTCKPSHPKYWQPFQRGGVCQPGKCFLCSIIRTINEKAESLLHTVSFLF